MGGIGVVQNKVPLFGITMHVGSYEKQLTITESDIKDFANGLVGVTSLAIRTLAGFAMGFVEGACVGAIMGFYLAIHLIVSHSICCISSPQYALATMIFIALVVGTCAAAVGIYIGVAAASTVFDNDYSSDGWAEWLPDFLLS